MKLDFSIAELKSFLEMRLGFDIQTLERLPGRSSSHNFVVCGNNGSKVVIKCLHSQRTGLVVSLKQIDSELSSSRFAVRRLFDDREDKFLDYRVLYYEWCDGDPIDSFLLDSSWIDGFRRDYIDFSNELQMVSSPLEHKPLAEWYSLATSGLRGIGAGFIMKLVRDSIENDCIGYESPPPVIIHGDFHAGNLFFKNARLSRVIDLESVAYGYPTEDIVRFFTCMIEHCGLFAWRRRARLASLFSDVTSAFGYSRREWFVAINGIILSRVATRGGVFGVGFFEALEEARKIRWYRKLKRMVRA